MKRSLGPCLFAEISCGILAGLWRGLPLAANAWKVLVEPKVHELATLITEIKIMALKIDGSALMPASSIAMTKGERRLSAPGALNNGLLAGTMRPTRKRLTM